MALGDMQLLQMLLNVMEYSRLEAVQELIHEHGFDQERVVNALRSLGIPCVTGGNEVYFHRFDVFTIIPIREMAEKHLSKERCDSVQFSCGST